MSDMTHKLVTDFPPRGTYEAVEQRPKPARAQVLEDAAQAVLRDRNIAYGPPEDSFRAIAEMWSGYLKAVWPDAPKLTPLDACNMMELLKVARSVSNPGHFDNYVDRAGYAACAADLVLPPNPDESDPFTGLED